MRRVLVAVIAVVAVVVAMAAAAAAGTVGWRGDGSTGWRHGSNGWMHGSVVSSEFAYLAEMVAHHEEAVAAARELDRTSRPQMRAFGAAIVETQSAQIDQMTAWLARWYPGRSTDVDYEPMMRDLSGLSGDELDRIFLEDMIGHHMAAVMMSQRLLVQGSADHEEVANLAESIRDEQRTEIFQMRRWLADWFETSGCPGSRRDTRTGMV